VQPPRADSTELPSQVEYVYQPETEALPAEGGVGVGGVADEEAASLPQPRGQPLLAREGRREARVAHAQVTRAALVEQALDEYRGHRGAGGDGGGESDPPVG
jgi:hypothetical protein